MKKELLSAIVSTLLFCSTTIAPINCSAENVYPTFYVSDVTSYSVDNTSEVFDNSATTTTTSTTPTETTTSTTHISQNDYDFEGAIFFKDYEWSYYVGDELDLERLSFELCVLDSNNTYSGEYVHNIFSYSSGKYSDLYKLDVSEVDMNKAGEYKIYLQTIDGVIGTFYTNKTRYLESGDYKVKMNGKKTSITINVEERPATTSTAVSTTTSSATTTTAAIVHDTPFYFEDNLVIKKGSFGVIGFSNEKNIDVKFEIDDESIAILVDPESKLVEIKGVSEGTTKIRAVSSDGTSATANIEVIIPDTTTTTTVYSQTTITTTTTVSTNVSNDSTTTTSNKYLTVYFNDKPLDKKDTITVNYMEEYLIPFTSLGKVEAEPVSEKVNVTVDNDNKLLHFFMNEAAYVYVILHDTESNEYFTLYAYASDMNSSTTTQLTTNTSTTTTTTTTTSTEELPQTGMPYARTVEGIATLLTLGGAALIIKSRKENDET